MMPHKPSLSILIADDEPLARQRLQRLLTSLSENYSVIGEACNGQETLELCQQYPVDVVLLDINMPALDGMTTAEKLQQQAHPPLIIFITAYEQHALAAFEKQAVDYLLKPVKQARLQQALLRAEQWLAAQPTPSAKSLTIKQANQCQRIPLDEIYYFRAEQKYVIARHRHGEYLLEQPLKTLEQDNAEFIRIHRNALVSLAHLKGVQKQQGKAYALFDGIADKLEISRRHLASILARF